ncbi:MucR family transcriptional regulator [Novosphingobium sp. AAP93]|uniref:MucR family transcriptional regulator n=1 Tax=Novosphingobium sp. AAP93 TaxID=1523427 RepID=UPI0006B9F348|nr:MucR family transcriptional regulator [Novosphingobium sp. AAP93]
MANETLIALTADIVAAHVSNNSVAVSDMPTLINAVHQALANAGAPAPVVEASREPAVSVRSSVKPDVVTCLECGFKGKMLKRHLMTTHGLTPQEYKARWNLSADHPLVAPNYAAKRGELAKAIGLGTKRGESGEA